MKTFKQFYTMLEGLMYSGKPMLPKTKKPEQTVKKATVGGHKTFQKRASRKIDQ